MKKYLKHIIFTIIVIFGIILSVALWLVQTNTGFALLRKYSHHYLSSHVQWHATQWQGNLWQGQIKKLSIGLPTGALVLSNIDYNWHWHWYDWHSQWAINTLSIKTVTWHTSGIKTPITPTQIINQLKASRHILITFLHWHPSDKIILPFTVANVSINKITLQNSPKNPPTIINNLHLSINHVEQQLRLLWRINGTWNSTGTLVLDRISPFKFSSLIKLAQPAQHAHWTFKINGALPHTYTGQIDSTIDKKSAITRFTSGRDAFKTNAVDILLPNQRIQGTASLYYPPKLAWNIKLDSQINANTSSLANANIWQIHLDTYKNTVAEQWHINLHTALLGINTVFKLKHKDHRTLVDFNALKFRIIDTRWQINHDQTLYFPEIKTHPSSLLCLHQKLQPENQLCFSIKNQQYHLKATLPSLAFIANIWPWLNPVNGSANGQYDLSFAHNTWQSAGNLDLTAKTIGLPGLNEQWHQLKLNLSLNTHSQLTAKAHWQAGKGKASLTANGNLKQHTLIVSLNAKDFLLSNLPQLHLIANAALIFNRNLNTQNLDGNINIIQAKIDANQFIKQAQQTADVELVNQAGQQINPSQSLPFNSTIALHISPQAQFKGFNINTHVQGNLVLTTLPGRATIADGTLNLINGDYTAYSKHFTVDQGQLVYNQAPITDPALNIKAIYQLNNLQVTSGSIQNLQLGINVGGTLLQPILTLFSTPAMSQEDILSYIVLGQPLNQANTSDATVLSQAAAVFALNGGSHGLLNQIQTHLGLNQLSFGNIDSGNSVIQLPNTSSSPASTAVQTDSSADSNAAVFAGKYLSPRFYISYGVGIFNAQQEVITQWILSRHWQLQGQASSFGSSAALIYTVKRH